MSESGDMLIDGLRSAGSLRLEISERRNEMLQAVRQIRQEPSWLKQ